MGSFSSGRPVKGGASDRRHHPGDEEAEYQEEGRRGPAAERRRLACFPPSAAGGGGGLRDPAEGVSQCKPANVFLCVFDLSPVRICEQIQPADPPFLGLVTKKSLLFWVNGLTFPVLLGQL